MSAFHKVMCGVDGSMVRAGTILAAGPLVRQPSTLPYRQVMRILPHHNDEVQFVVHTQSWVEGHTMEDGTLHPDMDRSGFSNGQYFDGNTKGLELATECFGKRVANDAQHVSTCLRDQ